MTGTPLVDVNIAVYNHAPYLRQTLESVLLQQTTFPFRLLIGDDCSTDGSIDILKEFEHRYPGQIKVIYQEKNLGLHSEERNGIIILKNSTAKYIALLDGDDYWSDPHKLQKQIDFLESNQDYAMCFHEVYRVEQGKEPEISWLDIGPRTFTLRDLAERGNFIFTLSVVFRNSISKLPDWYGKSPLGDYSLYMLNASYGKLYYMPEPMAVYRKFVGVYGKNAVKQNNNWYKTLDLLITHFEDEEILRLLRKNQARALLFMYNNGAMEELNEHDPRLKEALDMVTIKSADQLTNLSTKMLFIALWRKLLLVLRHNPVVNKIAALKNNNQGSFKKSEDI